jgi:transposase
MRRSFDGLARAIDEYLGENPQSGAVFCFINRSANRLKILWWDKNGYCILYKRLHDAMFELPEHPRGRLAIKMDGGQLASLVAGAQRKRVRKIA